MKATRIGFAPQRVTLPAIIALVLILCGAPSAMSGRDASAAGTGLGSGSAELFGGPRAGGSPAPRMSPGQKLGSMATVLADGSRGSTTSASSSGALLRYFPQYMGADPHYSQAQAVAIAQQFHVIAAHKGVFTSFVGAMKAANPSLVLVAYMNGMFDHSGWAA